MAPPYVMIGLSAATMVQGTASYGLVEDAAIVVADGFIEWVGPAADLPSDYAGLDQQTHNGRLVTPALIDCHTHIVHGGNRAREFEMRLNGASYEEVARAGLGLGHGAPVPRPAIASATATVRLAISACSSSTILPSTRMTPLPRVSGSAKAATMVRARATSWA